MSAANQEKEITMLSKEKKELNWAVLGTGVIANQMAQALGTMGRTLYGVGNRTYEKAVAFGEKYQVEKVFLQRKSQSLSIRTRI